MALPKFKKNLPAVSDEQPNHQFTEQEFNFILMKNLTTRHYEDPNVMKFVLVYAETDNVEHAAKEAGLPDKRSGQNLLRRRDVFEAVRQLKQKMTYKGYTGDEIVARVNNIAQASLRDIFKEDGTVKRWHEIPDTAVSAIKEITVREVFVKDVNGIKEFDGYIVKVKLKDDLKALELMGRNEGKFVERKIVENDIGKNMRNVLLAKTRAEERKLEIQSKMDSKQVRDIEPRDVTGEEKED